MLKNKGGTIPVKIHLPYHLWVALMVARSMGRVKSIKSFIVALVAQALGTRCATGNGK